MQDTAARAVLSSAIRLILVKVLGAIAILLATTVAVMAQMIPLPRARPVGIPGDLTSAETVVSPCRSRLAEIAAFKPLPSITGPGDCTATDVVALDAVLLPDKHRIALFPAATLRCPMAEAVTHWIRDDVAPTIAAQGKSLRGVETLDSFDCRPRNGIKNAKISEHGRANALDVRAFKLANGAAVGTIKGWIQYSIFVVIFACVCWVTPSVYSIKYAVSADKIYLDPKPKDCDFWRAPFGTKGCHYQRIVIARYAKGIREIRPGEGDPNEQFDSILISWAKKSD